MKKFLALLIFGGLISAMGKAPKKEKSEDEIKFCTMDVKQCADGSFVSRDPENNCEFKKCPGE